MPPSNGGASPSAPPPVLTPGACIGPDPFSSIPWLKGVCVNGGWVPAVR
jgi:hypothetical protein